MTTQPSLTPAAFAAKWHGVTTTEKASAQEHFVDLCRMLGESTVHPGATDVLMDVFTEGQRRSQVVLTTHSPDILDSRKVRDDQLRVVTARAGKTSVSPLSAISREAVRKGLYSPGELLRANSLKPDLTASRQLSAELDLFAAPERPSSE